MNKTSDSDIISVLILLKNKVVIQVVNVLCLRRAIQSARLVFYLGHYGFDSGFSYYEICPLCCLKQQGRVEVRSDPHSAYALLA